MEFFKKSLLNVPYDPKFWVKTVYRTVSIKRPDLKFFWKFLFTISPDMHISIINFNQNDFTLLCKRILHLIESIWKVCMVYKWLQVSNIKYNPKILRPLKSWLYCLYQTSWFESLIRTIGKMKAWRAYCTVLIIEWWE